MKIAIMGAGMAGLSCAITLERLGVAPTVFEKRSCVGDRFVNAETMFSILDRPVKNTISYLAERFGIELEPVGPVDNMVFHSKNNIGTIKGTLGFINVRGRREDSYESQLARQVKTDIIFGSDYTYEDLCRNFDSVVLATGDGAYACALGNYRSDLTCSIKGATVEGEFTPGAPHVWFNYQLLPKGYAWLIPYSDKEANLVIAYPDYPDNIKRDIDSVWESFFKLASGYLRQHLRITDAFEITRYMMGICNKPKIGNTYYAGNCFGALSPGLGFGQFSSILTGVYAAWDICKKGAYEELTRPIMENYNHSLALRRYLETLDDDKLDRRINNLNSFVFDKMIEKLFSVDHGIDLLKWSTPMLRLLAKNPDN